MGQDLINIALHDEWSKRPLHESYGAYTPYEHQAYDNYIFTLAPYPLYYGWQYEDRIRTIPLKTMMVDAPNIKWQNVADKYKKIMTQDEAVRTLVDRFPPPPKEDKRPWYEKTADKIKETAEKIKDTPDSIKEKISDIGHDIQEKVEDKISDVTDDVKTKTEDMAKDELKKMMPYIIGGGVLLYLILG